ncbi:MAG: site-specific integrase [Clostridia bacterium]
MAKKKVKVIEKSRRPNGEGSIYQLRNGLWCAKVSYKDEEEKPQRRTFYGHSNIEVAKKMDEFKGKISTYNAKAFKEITFGELMEEWLLTFKKSVVVGRTFEGNIRVFNLHIKPFIGNMKIEEVNPIVIQKLLNQMLEDKYSLNYTKKAKFLINQFFEYCVDNKLCEQNPTLRTRVKSKDKKTYDREDMYKAIPPEARILFIEKLNNHPFLKAFCMTGMFAGLRAGELLALKWDNIDLKNKTIKVEHGVTQVPQFDDKGNVLSRKTVIGDTKTACSVREVPIPDLLVDALNDWKKEQWVKSNLYGNDLINSQAIVFCNNNGSIRTYSGTRRIFDRFLKHYQLTNLGIHFHTLRHTYSNMLFEANENPKIIQSLLGHKSVKTTITCYNSVDKSYFKQATDKLNKLFDKEHMELYKKLQEKPNAPVYNKSIEEMQKDSGDYDPEMEMLEKMLAERKARKKLDFDM